MRLLLLLLLLLPACSRAEKSPPPGPEFTIVHVGDVNLAEDVEPLLEERGPSFVFDRVRPHLKGDFLVGNLETVVAHRPAEDRIDKVSIHLMEPRYLGALVAEGFDLVTVANNHAMDQRAPAMLEMLGHLDAAGLKRVGAGRDLAEASAPVVIEAGEARVAFLGTYQVTKNKKTLDWYAAPDVPGVWGLRTREVAARTAELRGQGVDLVIATVHWGPNYADENGGMRKLARALVAAGVDAIVGHGAHIQQGTELIDGVPVLYGIGNFTFGSKGLYSRRSPDNRLSSIVRLVVAGKAIRRVELLPVRTDNRRVEYQPVVPDAEQAKREFEPTLDRYGVPWKRRADGWYVIEPAR